MPGITGGSTIASSSQINDGVVTSGDIANDSILNEDLNSNIAIPESKILLSDNTTLDVSITKHGLVPKAPNDTTKFLRGDGTWTTIPNPLVYKNGTDISRGGAAASSVLNIAHGLGTIPKKVRITAFYNANTAGNVDLSSSYGSYNGTTNSCVYNVVNAGGGLLLNTDNTYGIFLSNMAGSADQKAVITVDATNIILTFTKTGVGLTGGYSIALMWEVE